MTVTETSTAPPAAPAPTATTTGKAAGPAAQLSPAAGQPASTSFGAARPAALDELAAVNDTDLTPDLDEIGRRAAHLAAFQRVVLTVAEARLAAGATKATELRRHARDLARALHWLDRHLTGDGRLAGWPSGRVRQQVQLALGRYSQAERAMVDALSDALDVGEMAGLARAYHQAALHAPTRAHPRLSYQGAVGRLTFRLAATVDAVRDGTDNRTAGRHVTARATQALRDLEERMMASTLAPAVASREAPALANSQTALP
jgi:hypothetical protein